MPLSVASLRHTEVTFTGILTFEDEGGQTRYTARARHWNAGDHAAHERMGIPEGWRIATNQLAALDATP